MGKFQENKLNTKLYELKQNEEIAKKIHNVVVKEGMEFYKNMFEAEPCGDITDMYWVRAIGLFRTLEEVQKKVFYEIIEQVIVDTTATLMGVLEGSTSLVGGGSFNSEIVIDGIDCQCLQDFFLSIVEEERRGKL